MEEKGPCVLSFSPHSAIGTASAIGIASHLLVLVPSHGPLLASLKPHDSPRCMPTQRSLVPAEPIVLVCSYVSYLHRVCEHNLVGLFEF